MRAAYCTHKLRYYRKGYRVACSRYWGSVAERDEVRYHVTSYILMIMCHNESVTDRGRQRRDEGTMRYDAMRYKDEERKEEMRDEREVCTNQEQQRTRRWTGMQDDHDMTFDDGMTGRRTEENAATTTTTTVHARTTDDLGLWAQKMRPPGPDRPLPLRRLRTTEQKSKRKKR